MLLQAQRGLNVKFDPTARPRSKPQDFDKLAWDHSLPFLDYSQQAEFSSDFGWRNLWGRRDFHGGVDLMAPVGTPIKAITDGKIAYLEKSGKNSGIVLQGVGQHSGHYFTYWHMTPVRNWKEGDYVRPGQVLGGLANWGANTHLHYAVHQSSSPNYKSRSDKNALHPLLYHANRIVASR